MSDTITAPTAPTDSPTPASPTWRPARTSAAPGHEFITVRGGLGSDGGSMIAEFKLARTGTPSGLAVSEAEARKPIEDALRSRLATSEARGRFVTLAGQVREAAKRTAIAAAKRDGIAAQRRLAEAEAGPKLGDRLARLTKEAAAIAEELAAAEAAAAELAPLMAAAKQAVEAELVKALPAVAADARSAMKAARQEARDAAVRALTGAATAELDELLRQECTFMKYAGRDWAGLVAELLAEAAGRGATPPDAAPPA